MKKITIAIDGHSSCGKSTMAKELARKVGYVYVDTGAMYRCVTLFALRHQLFAADGSVMEEQLREAMPEIDIDQRLVDGKTTTFLNGENVELERFAPAAMTEETAESQAGSRAECEENQTENQQENPAEVYPILEVNVTGKSTRDMHRYRHNAGSTSCDFRYQSHQVTEQAGGKELVIDLKTDSDVWAHYHMRFYDGVPVVRVYSVLENRGTERHAVEYISSFVYQNLCGDGEKPYYDKTDVWIPFNSWSCDWFRCSV